MNSWKSNTPHYLIICNFKNRMRLVNYLKENEQRKFPRKKTNVPCVIHVGEFQYLGSIQDISQGGVKLEVVESANLNDTFLIQFYFDIHLFKYSCSVILKEGNMVTAAFINRESDSSDNLGFMLNIIDMGEDLI